ncbi:MAG TPA: helix-turn-helix transcriptional regulator [Sphingomicrobium sp.]|jgi:transcriptional regulator with XRE-family HTH domain|nr:helix-turn-helix transcriptional regulator [Sphingomicrobium sp.]
MITRIREVRKARGLTLDEVATRCQPPTTPQTIGRLETGTRTVSVGWLNRIAHALGVEAQDLVAAGDAPAELKVAAVISASGAAAPRKAAIVIPPRVMDSQVAVTVSSSLGNYRSGDEIWCDVLDPESFGRGLNRDVLVPRAAGRFLFGRLIDRDADKLQILPLEGGRQQIVSNPPWIAIASRLVRTL